jgi:hypothetical protein
MDFRRPSEFIESIHDRFYEKLKTERISPDHMSYIDFYLRFFWPGDYHIEQPFDKDRQQYVISIVFHNPHDESLWWLKNS